MHGCGNSCNLFSVCQVHIGDMVSTSRVLMQMPHHLQEHVEVILSRKSNSLGGGSERLPSSIAPARPPFFRPTPKKSDIRPLIPTSVGTGSLGQLLPLEKQNGCA